MNFLIPDKEKKLTEAEIMKALECCITAKTFGDCSKMKCPASTKNGCRFYLRTDEEYENTIYIEIFKDVIDLLNSKNSENEALKSAVDNSTKEFLKLHDDYQEQKAEIERLELENKMLSQKRVNMFERLEIVEKARAKAIKEFADRVKDNLEDGWLFGKDAVCRRIDQIAKEMGVEL